MESEQRKFKFNNKNGVIVNALTSEYVLSAVCAQQLLRNYKITTLITGCRSRYIESLFQEPFDSAKILGTCLVDRNNMGDEEQFPIDDVELKFAGFPSGNRLLLVFKKLTLSYI